MVRRTVSRCEFRVSSKRWLKTVLAMLAGALLTLAVQSLGGRWGRRAEAATLDQIARSGMSGVAQLIHSIPWIGGDKIRGVTGLGDGRTFIVYTDEKINFYQFYAGPTTSSTP